MSGTDTVISGDHQQRKVTFSQSDLDDVSASLLFSEQENLFIDNLNLDKEEKKTTTATQQPEATVVEEESKQVNMDDIKMYVLKCVSLQDAMESSTLAPIEPDFYDKVELCIDEITENSFFRIESFVNVRAERIIMYSKSFSENILNKLTTDERELYIELCESVNKYRTKMNKRLGNDK